jgi:hypothetical protein
VATTRLKIYNGALLIVGERSISALTDRVEPRFLLDNVWNDGGIRYCIEQAQWRFAMRATRQTYDPAVEPAFGYRRAFPKPTDWVATSAVCQDEFFNVPLTQYSDETSFWFADWDEIFVKYVSDHADYGSNLSLWPFSFTEYVKHYFAGKIVEKLPGKESLVARLLGAPGRPETGTVHGALITAKNRDAMAGPTTFPARGSWVRARFGSRAGWNDGGNRGSLIG